MNFGRKDYNDMFTVKFDRTPSPAKHMDAEEPVFLLMAIDPLAEGRVREWADALVAADGDPAMVKSARDQADKMKKWPGDGQDKKLPDLP